MADGVTSDSRAEKKQRLLREEKKEENAQSPPARNSKMTNSAEDWVNFAENNPDDFLSIIIDDFSSLRLVQALFVTASVGLVRTSMGKNHHGAHHHSLNDIYLQRMGFVAGLSVFCNLFGIILAIFVSVQCRGMREMKASGEHVVSIMPRLFTLFYITMASFILGMILMVFAVCILLFTTETWEMSIFFLFLAVCMLVALICLLTKFSFGSSIATHSLTLAFETVNRPVQGLEGAAASLAGHVQEGYGAVRSTVTRMGTKEDESDKDDIEKADGKEKATETKKGAKASSSAESAAEDAKESGKAAASKESSEKPDEKPKDDPTAK
jgi:ABC-type multidrug transport system fused ATPase/permease subunit